MPTRKRGPFPCMAQHRLFRLSPSYMSFSKRRQHMSLPQTPEILVGFRDSPWFLAILMETGAKSPRKVAQQRGLPQEPMPDTCLASSLTPTCRSSMRVWKTAASSFTSSRKSTLPSEVKKKTILFLSKVYSARRSFIGTLNFSIFFRQISKADFSLSLFRSSWAISFMVALRMAGFKGASSSSTGCLGMITTLPYSSPRDVSTITPSSRWISR